MLKDILGGNCLDGCNIFATVIMNRHEQKIGRLYIRLLATKIVLKIFNQTAKYRKLQ
jgi:hypothetical protein